MPEIDLELGKQQIDNNDTIIDTKSITNENIKSFFLFVFTASPEKFKAAFAKHGLKVQTKDDVEKLATIAEQDIDKDEHNINLTDIVKGIILTQDEISNACNGINFI